MLYLNVLKHFLRALVMLTTKISYNKTLRYGYWCYYYTGPGKEQDVLIPNIPMIPKALPCKFRRLQFPLKLAF